VPLSPSSRIGQYEIVAPLGAGGMGEVYRARDPKLGRDVALKILPEAFANDPARLMRFEREARTLASLNHPHIAQVYGIEDSGTTRALVMELVAGDDLSARIARGPIPLDEALPLARQIAEALEAAHEAGIIHRDLKPANIKVRDDGTVKVLDFGLAKALDGAGEAGGAGRAGGDSPTVTSPAMTMRGAILGTAAYMAPEQAKGKPVDKRADIWAFGCVLYEMLTGKRAFEGDDITDTIVAVMSKEPGWSRLPPATPPAVALLLRRCLDKRVHSRLPHIGVARLEFDALAAAPAPRDSAAAAAPPQRGASIGVLLGVAVVAAAVAGAAGWTWASRSAPVETPAVYRSTLLIRDSDLTGAPPSTRFAISPDGRHVAYVGSDGEDTRLYVRALDSLDARVVERSDGAAAPFWSPDSREVAFFTSAGLQAAAIAGGEPRTVLARGASRIIVGGTWGESGMLVALAGGLATVPASGGPLTAIREPDGAADEDMLGYPHFLPDGRRFLFVAYRGLMPTAVYMSSLDDPSSRTRIMEGGSNVQYANGHLLFMRRSVLVAQRFDPETARLEGEPVTLGEALMPNVAVPFGGAFSASRTGAVVYQQLRTGEAGLGNTLVWRSRMGTPQPLNLETGSYRSVAIAPTRPQALVGRLDDRGGSSLWLVDLARGVSTRFTFGLENVGVFTPDGATVVYNSSRAGRLDLFRRRLDLGATEAPVPAGEEDRPRTPLSVSPDGRLLLFAAPDPTTGNDLWQVPLDGSSPAIVMLAGAFEERWGAFSPDGRWVVYESDESGRREIYVRAFSGAGTLTQVSPNGGMYPRWSRDGREIYFYAAGKLHAASVRQQESSLDIVAVAPLFDVTPPSGFRRQFYDVAADGRFLMIADTTSPGPTQLTLMLNWPELTRSAR